MASNQRENQRKIRKQNKQRKTRIIIWSVLIVIIIALVVMRVVEVNFNSIKNHFTDDDGNVSISAKSSDGNYPYLLDSSENIKTFYQNDKLDVLTDTSCTVLNPKDGESIYSFKHGFANPVMKAAGNYFCIIDQGAQRIRLDNLKQNEFEFETDNPLLCADVAKNGTIVYATSSSENKSSLYVVNKSRKQLLKYNFNGGYIVSVAIDSSGRRCAFSAISSKDARLLTTVYTINTGDKKTRASFEHPSVNTLDLHYCGDDLYFVGDTCLYTISAQKKETKVFDAESVNTVCFCYSKNDELIYVYSNYSSASENKLVTVSSAGKVKKTVSLSKKPKGVSCVNGEICLLFGDNIKIYSRSGGEETENYKCDDSVTSAYKLSSKILVSKGRQIDVID